MSSWIDLLGAIGATLTTLCWLPQVTKIVRERETRAISLGMTLIFAVGVALWLAYGLALMDWPLIIASAMELALMSFITTMKLRYG